MAQTGYTPISIYYSATAAATPTAGNLVAGELAINTADGKLFYKDSSGVVQTLATKDATSGSFTNLAYTGTLTGGTGVVNLGSGQFYKDASGNVGIGITPFTNTLSKSLDLVNGAGLFGYSNNSYLTNNLYYDSAWKYKGTGFGTTIIGNSADGAIQFNGTATSGSASASATVSERMRIDSSGNVGIGTSSPTSKLGVISDGAPASSGNMSTGLYVGAANSYGINIGGSSSGAYAWINAAFLNNSGTAASLVLATGSTERVRIDTSGRFYVNQTGQSGNTAQRMGLLFNGNAEWGINITTSSNSGNAINFTNASGTQIGQVQVSSTNTAYVTSSDYRLKENVALMSGALDKVAQLKPCTYTWKADGSSGQGFIAHELQAVVPDCVFGEKDAVETVNEFDAEGKIIGTKEMPKYQGIDTSFLVATLTAAIQELNAKVTALEEQVIALSVK